MNGGWICSLCLSWDVYLSCLLTLLLLVHRSSNWTHYIAGFFPWISSLQMAYHGTSQPLQWCEPISIINLPLYISLYTLLVCFSGEPLLIHRTTHAHPSCRDLTASSHSFKICLPLHSFHPIGLLSFHQYIKIRLSCSSSAYPLSLTQGKYYPWTPPSPARHSGFAHGTWFLSLSYPAHFNLNGFLEISFQKQNLLPALPHQSKNRTVFLLDTVFLLFSLEVHLIFESVIWLDSLRSQSIKLSNFHMDF